MANGSSSNVFIKTANDSCNVFLQMANYWRSCINLRWSCFLSSSVNACTAVVFCPIQFLTSMGGHRRVGPNYPAINRQNQHNEKTYHECHTVRLRPSLFDLLNIFLPCRCHLSCPSWASIGIWDAINRKKCLKKSGKRLQSWYNFARSRW